MDIKEKIHAGELYFANNQELVEERMAAKEILFEINNLSYNEIEKKNVLLKKILGNIGENAEIIQPFYCDYGYNITVGKNFFANYNCIILDGAKVLIGDNVFLAPNVGIYTAGHPLDVERRNKGLEYAYPVKIGNNVWIGAGVNILPGVTIGDNCVIGAGSVVVKDIPANSLAVGNPCKVVKEINNE